jgi:hypothetical protein
MTSETPRFDCPVCGHQRTAQFCWQCDVPAGSDRGGFLETATTVVATTALLPLVQAIATKAGEDVWAKIAEWLPERMRRRSGQEEVLEIVSPDRRLTIVTPVRLTAEASRHLRDVVESLENSDGSHRLTYDAAAKSWLIERIRPELP